MLGRLKANISMNIIERTVDIVFAFLMLREKKITFLKRLIGAVLVQDDDICLYKTTIYYYSIFKLHMFSLLQAIRSYKQCTIIVLKPRTKDSIKE